MPVVNYRVIDCPQGHRYVYSPGYSPTDDQGEAVCTFCIQVDLNGVVRELKLLDQVVDELGVAINRMRSRNPCSPLYQPPEDEG